MYSNLRGSKRLLRRIALPRKTLFEKKNAEKAAYWQNFSSENLHEFRKERIVNSYKYGNFN